LLHYCQSRCGSLSGSRSNSQRRKDLTIAALIRYLQDLAS
jgi:hypothetical protein